jgi:photosystem II stability/assembly factor-like uncharacterized protein
MPDLAERLREFVDTAQPPVTMDEVKETVNRSSRHAKGSTQLPPRLVFVPVMALLLLAAIVVPILVMGSDSSNMGRVAGSAAPRWSLAVDSQQPSWDVQGSANPDSYALVCPTQTDCYATSPSSTTTTDPSGVVQVSNDGGQSWHSSLIAGAGSDLYGLTCPTAQACMVTGEDFASGNLGVTMFSTNDGGATWTAQPIPGGSLGSSLLSCSSTMQCVATMSESGPGGQGEQDLALVTWDGGAHWAAIPFPGTFRPYALQCQAGGHCVAVGQSPTDYIITSPTSMHGFGSVLISNDGGLTWQAGQVPTADSLTSLSCADSLHCMAIESSTIATGAPAPAGYSLVDTFITTNNGGQTWTATPGNDPNQWALSAISCPTALECWATGGSHPPEAPTSTYASWQGFVLETSDGGRTWNSVELPHYNGSPITAVTSLSCPDSSKCFALASDPTSQSTGMNRLVLVSRAVPS